jgi:hypothetical protein
MELIDLTEGRSGIRIPMALQLATQAPAQISFVHIRQCFGAIVPGVTDALMCVIFTMELARAGPDSAGHNIIATSNVAQILATLTNISFLIAEISCLHQRSQSGHPLELRTVRILQPIQKSERLLAHLTNIPGMLERHADRLHMI